MHNLFNDVRILKLPDSEISYHPSFISPTKADDYFQNLRDTTPWQQDDITVFGKSYPQPRLTALYANNNKPYSYSSISMQPSVFTKELLEIKNMVESVARVEFTTCLINRYRTGRDSNGWHADNEKELGKNPVIASISLGTERFFNLKHSTNPALKHKLLLEHGSLLIMRGETQHFWKHQIAKTAKVIGERINLTFRIIK
ncbi:alpha-ketoglutarate-dependent dioxygenase AlkB family protein [Maribacter sp. ACAM166]|uniref:alpha-ketoglutarate-dependent dioxygenase AlkB family protein n=1 Tax=Maribacter sp. ACAM166 TaxID=2508996 RepID=UPI0010FEEA3E|nr:alpha-ketoglutarate-dependent dioxygenase AlkB [Maribacter sp. ACAM166]TLP73995.1 alpha-ketoglutarate-dependent dioxygenase AlkB [Maribacter sp. ACAM166]